MTIPGLFVIELNKCFPPHLRGDGHEKSHWETRARDGDAAIGILKHTFHAQMELRPLWGSTRILWQWVSSSPSSPRLPPPSGCCSRLKVFNIPDLGCFCAVSTEERLKKTPSLTVGFCICKSLIQLQCFWSRALNLHPFCNMWLSSWSEWTGLLLESAVCRTHAAFADIHFETTQITWVTIRREKCLLSSTVNIPLTQCERGEIYEIHMFNTFHFVPRICTAYHSSLGSKRSV